MNWHETVLETIDLRSFSNLWFWIFLAVLWSCASHWVFGIPYGLILRAARNGGQAQQDVEALADINARRIQTLWSASGPIITGVLAALVSCLVILGWSFGIEFAQALTLLLCPFCLIGYIHIDTARRILQSEGQGEALFRRLRILRMLTQLIGMVAIFVTAMWGMFVNLALGVFF